MSIEKEIPNLIKKLSIFNFDIVWHLAANSDIRGYENGLKVDFNNTFMTTINTGIIMENLGIDEIVFLLHLQRLKYRYCNSRKLWSRFTQFILWINEISI